MSIDKCTPGKWKADLETVDGNGMIVDDECNVIAEIIKNPSDAKLIAHSKLMYEALFQILNMSDPGSYEKAVFEMKKMAREALPKL